jgi:hypothetical protein
MFPRGGLLEQNLCSMRGQLQSMFPREGLSG